MKPPNVTAYVPSNTQVAASPSGVRMTVRAGGAQTNGAYAILECEHPPGDEANVLPHIHSAEDEAMYVLEGQIIITLDEREIDARAGAFVLMPRGVLMSHRNPGPGTARYLSIFSPAGMEQYFTIAAEIHPLKDADQKLAALRERYGLRFIAPTA